MKISRWRLAVLDDFDNSYLTFVACAYKIGIDRVKNFLSWNRELFEKYSANVVIVSDKPLDLALEWARTIVYPVEQKVFSIPKTVNYGIKRVEGNGIIIKTDPDIVFSEELVQRLIAEVKPGLGIVSMCSEIGKFESISKVQWSRAKILRNGRGGCFAMSKHDWVSMNGYDERIKGWGADDEEMWRRAMRNIKMIQTQEHPLYHIKHPVRKDNKFFPKLSKRNLAFCKTLDWKSETWGEADV
jgi:hypothetical protein